MHMQARDVVVVVGTSQAGGLSFEKIPEASHQARARRGTAPSRLEALQLTATDLAWDLASFDDI